MFLDSPHLIMIYFSFRFTDFMELLEKLHIPNMDDAFDFVDDHGHLHRRKRDILSRKKREVVTPAPVAEVTTVVGMPT